MGVIARQAIKGTIYSYIGAFLGFINVALLMPHIFSTEEVGLVNLLVAVALIIGQFGALGFPNVTVRLFPFFRNKEVNNNGFLFILLCVGLGGFLLASGAYFFLKDYLIAQNIEDSPLFVDYIYLLLPLIFAYIFISLIDTYNRVLFNASFGIFVKEFLLRILNFIGIALFYFGVFDFHGFIIYYTVAYGVPLFLLVGLLVYRKQFVLKPALKFVSSKMRVEMISVAFFGLLSGFSNIAAMYIDKYMINHFFDLNATAVYAISFYFGAIILLPGRALLKISTTFVTEAFKAKDMDTIKSLYVKSSLNQFITGCLVFLILWGNIDSVLLVLPEAYHQGKYVILFIGLSHLTIMASGLSSEIIIYSQYYRQYALILFSLISLIVVFNLLLIPLYGLNGAAMASLLSYAFYILIKIVFIFFAFGFQPFSYKHLLAVAFAVVSYLISILIPSTPYYILTFVIKSLVLFLVFITPIYLLSVSQDLNDVVNMVLRKLKLSCIIHKK